MKPVELNPKPRAISATYDVGEVGDDKELVLDNTSPIVEIEHNVWLGQQVQFWKNKTEKPFSPKLPDSIPKFSRMFWSIPKYSIVFQNIPEYSTIFRDYLKY